MENQNSTEPGFEDRPDERSLVNVLKRNVKEFMSTSSLHGLKYIVDEDITFCERLFFGVSFVFVILCSAFFISNIYDKWTSSPMIITTSPEPTFITSIPFPAVTICSLNQALKSRVVNIDRFSSNYSLLMSLCNKRNALDHFIEQSTWKKFKVLLIGVSQPCDSMLMFCQFGSNVEDCAKIFHPVLTDDGLCCTFNAVDPIFLLRNYTEDERFQENSDEDYIPIDWTPEMGFDRNLPSKFYPRIPEGTGSHMGLTVLLNVSKAEYYCSSTKSLGFKVLVHNPAEQPKIGSYGFLVTNGRENRIAINPQYQTARPSIRMINTSIRQCLFSDEGNLTFFRTYSRKNCELECEARIIFENCDCILYYLPRIEPDTKICGPNDNSCTKLIQSDIHSSKGKYSCNSCLPACFELSYNPTITATKMVEGNFFTNDDYPTESFADIDDISLLHLYFVTTVFHTTEKGEIFGFTEFLSNTGGLLGLFMGFSVFSVIEILYFLVLRPNCQHRVQRRRKRGNRMRTRTIWVTPMKADRVTKNVGRKRQNLFSRCKRIMFTNSSPERFPYLN